MQRSHLLLVLVLIIFGAANTICTLIFIIVLSLQNKQKIPQAAPNQIFFHPFIQTAVMFLG
jgi:hypothetical protein